MARRVAATDGAGLEELGPVVAHQLLGDVTVIQLAAAAMAAGWDQLVPSERWRLGSLLETRAVQLGERVAALPPGYATRVAEPLRGALADIDALLHCVDSNGAGGSTSADLSTRAERIEATLQQVVQGVGLRT